MLSFNFRSRASKSLRVRAIFFFSVETSASVAFSFSFARRTASALPRRARTSSALPAWQLLQIAPGHFAAVLLRSFLFLLRFGQFEARLLSALAPASSAQRSRFATRGNWPLAQCLRARG